MPLIISGDADNDQLSVTPLVGLGKSSLLNKTIFHLMPCAEQKLTICTPYFNLPAILVRNIIQLLREGKRSKLLLVIKPRMTSTFRKMNLSR